MGRRRLFARIATAAFVTLAVAVLAVIGKAWYDSRLPGTYSVMDHGTHDYGGGAEPAPHTGHGSRSVADLRTSRSGKADRSFALTARHAELRFASGRTLDALTFDGTSPGPELRVRQGDLVEVTLENADVEGGVTIHWHGVDVPNAEDGVAGVTQDAVLPGERFLYRFRAEQVGTFWYHTHQVSSKEVRRGLFGALVIEPREGSTFDVDEVVLVHTFSGVPTLDGHDGVDRREVEPGASVRYRLVNTDSAQHRFEIWGTRFRVFAIDGTDLNQPSLLERTAVIVPAGGRLDLVFSMPSVPVHVLLDDASARIALNAQGTTMPVTAPTVDFDPITYGERSQTPFAANSPFDRRFDLTITRKPGFFDGRPGLQWALNGGIYPDVPVFVVEEGDLVEVTIANESGKVHPMHLHGHHVLVLSRNGEPSTGSPWWSDTLNVLPDETYVVAFRADNPGIWMDHCHNLPHAADGLTMHVAYAGVSTPFEIGGGHHNEPE
jgi:FtsP/CotA-like multicopper oxidase with cupredoxin domain